MAQADFAVIYKQLRKILEPYVDRMGAVRASDQEYALDTPYSARWSKPLFFASTVMKKNYVSFYLMPVYMHPELLEGISPQLAKRMQGKSCFNFKTNDEALLAELARLTERGYQKLIEAGDIA